jgi:hypothetical protein
MEREPPPSEIEEQLEAIAERYLEALRAGLPPDRSALTAAHPGLAPWLERRLRMTELLHEVSGRGGGRTTREEAPRCPHGGEASEPPGPRPD